MKFSHIKNFLRFCHYKSRHTNTRRGEFLGNPRSQPIRHPRGESLVEILVAFFVIATTSTASLVVVSQSANSSRSVENRFMAQHIAEEGLEAFVHLRDTNWIKFHDKNCWDAKLDQEACDENGGEKLLPQNGAAFYKIILEPNDMRWSIEKVDNELDLTKKIATTQQKPFFEPYGLYEIKNDSVKNGMLFGFNGDQTPNADDPKFYRMLKLEILNDNKKSIKATVKVQWIATGEVREISLGKIFTNY